MKMQKKLLVVANLLNKSHLKKINHFCNNTLHNDIEIHLAYIIPVIPVYYFQIPSTQLRQDAEEEHAILKLEESAAILKVSKSNQWLLHGSINWAAYVLAEKLNIEHEDVILEDDMEDIEYILNDLLAWRDNIPGSSELLNSINPKVCKDFFYDFSSL